MRNRLDGDQALDIAKQVVAENPGISQDEMNEKAEALARMVRENSPPAEMPISRAGPTMKMSEPIDRSELLEPRMETIPQYQEAERRLGISDEPGRYYDAAEPKSDFLTRLDARMKETPPTGFATRLGEQILGRGQYDDINDALDAAANSRLVTPAFLGLKSHEPGRYYDAAERRQTPGTSVTMDYTMGQSQQLAELRSDPAFGVGFRQGINDYEKMKSESPDTIIDDLSGSIDEANMARESLFRGNVDPRDLKRLGYAEAMEYADREEKNIEEKALRQGMMDR